MPLTPGDIFTVSGRGGAAVGAAATAGAGSAAAGRDVVGAAAPEQAASASAQTISAAGRTEGIMRGPRATRRYSAGVALVAWAIAVTTIGCAPRAAPATDGAPPAGAQAGAGPPPRTSVAAALAVVGSVSMVAPVAT